MADGALWLLSFSGVVSFAVPHTTLLAAEVGAVAHPPPSDFSSAQLFFDFIEVRRLVYTALVSCRCSLQPMLAKHSFPSCRGRGTAALWAHLPTTFSSVQWSCQMRYPWQKLRRSELQKRRCVRAHGRTGRVEPHFPNLQFHEACFSPCSLLLDVQPCTGQLGETRLPAQVCNLQQGQRWCTALGLDGTAVWGTEHLLAALECCGVDNARIEVEGGKGKPLSSCL